MPKQRQKLNISSLQDFVLDERNIEKILNFTSDKPNVVKKNQNDLLLKSRQILIFYYQDFLTLFFGVII